MLDRIVISLIILGGLGLLWWAWHYYKIKVVQSIRPTDVTPGMPTLLYFSADYCAPCKFQQAPIVDKLAAKLGDAVAIKKFDVNQHPELADRYKILTLPTTVVLNSQGQVVHINYGVTEQARLEAQLS